VILYRYPTPKGRYSQITSKDEKHGTESIPTESYGEEKNEVL
jgi:hypothetical protein